MKSLALAVTLVTAWASPSFAFYQEMRCERNVTSGEMKLEPQTAYVVKFWDSYRIIGGQDMGLEGHPVPVPNRPGWVSAMCVVEGHSASSPEPPPFRFR